MTLRTSAATEQAHLCQLEDHTHHLGLLLVIRTLDPSHLQANADLDIRYAWPGRDETVSA